MELPYETLQKSAKKNIYKENMSQTEFIKNWSSIYEEIMFYRLNVSGSVCTEAQKAFSTLWGGGFQPPFRGQFRLHSGRWEPGSKSSAS